MRLFYGKTPRSIITCKACEAHQKRCNAYACNHQKKREHSRHSDDVVGKKLCLLPLAHRAVTHIYGNDHSGERSAYAGEDNVGNVYCIRIDIDVYTVGAKNRHINLRAQQCKKP